MEAYETTLAKYGAHDAVDSGVIESVKNVMQQSQATAFESQLCRTLLKPDAEQKSGIVKYVAIYATVPPELVQPVLWAVAQRILG